ncbi:MAG: hypothetical protein IJV40_01870 [Oscillospiraceae bacterium]|nr:hypothetical protein [Oscillospiraceae bacterium]
MQRVSFNETGREETEGHSSKGNQPKWLSAGKWYKADHMGYEGLAEVLISKLLRKSNVPEYVEYEPVLIEFDGKRVPGCCSDNFKTQDEILIPIERLHRAYCGRGLAQQIARMELPNKISYTVDFVEKTTDLKNFGAYLTIILELDSLFLNEDRHTNNIAVIRNEKTQQFRLCPVYDNGLSLLSDWNDYPIDQDIYQSISRVQAKPFDRNFDEQAEAAEQLYHPQLKLHFTRKDLAGILAELRDYYSAEILDHVERIVLEQMRKYPPFFRRDCRDG